MAFRASGVKRGTMLRKSLLSNVVLSVIAPPGRMEGPSESSVRAAVAVDPRHDLVEDPRLVPAVAAGALLERDIPGRPRRRGARRRGRVGAPRHAPAAGRSRACWQHIPTSARCAECSSSRTAAHGVTTKATTSRTARIAKKTSSAATHPRWWPPGAASPRAASPIHSMASRSMELRSVYGKMTSAAIGSC